MPASSVTHSALQNASASACVALTLPPGLHFFVRKCFLRTENLATLNTWPSSAVNPVYLRCHHEFCELLDFSRLLSETNHPRLLGGLPAVHDNGPQRGALGCATPSAHTHPLPRYPQNRTFGQRIFARQCRLGQNVSRSVQNREHVARTARRGALVSARALLF